MQNLWTLRLKSTHLPGHLVEVVDIDDLFLEDKSHTPTHLVDVRYASKTSAVAGGAFLCIRHW